MPREIIHIYGPFSIQSYGLAIVAAIIIFSWLVLTDKKRIDLISSDQFTSLILWSIVAALIGGRILWLAANRQNLTTWYEIAYIWQGGFSLMGSMLALLITIPIFLRIHAIQIIPLLDLIAVYCPLLTAISRLGCFAAGCCYGRPSDYVWTVAYTDQASFAPLNISLHPTQLYSAFTLGLLCTILYWLAKKERYQGTLFGLYLIGAGLERCIVDYFRGDQEWVAGFGFLSMHQLIACFVIILGIAYSLINTRADLKQVAQ